MRHEKIFQRTEGKQVKISVNIFVGSGKTQYKTNVEWAEKGKRTWTDVTNDNERSFRQLTPEAQEEKKTADKLTLVSEQELLEAKIEAWEKIKPTR